MSLCVHPYDNNCDGYNFFFHPLHFKNKEISALSIITNIFITVITLGFYQIAFWIINRLDDKKLEIWKKENAEKVSQITTQLLSSNVHEKNVSPDFTKNFDQGYQIASSTVKSIQEMGGISKELMDSLAYDMWAYGNANSLFLYQAYYFPPRDPFELFIHETLDNFKFRSLTGKDIFPDIKKRIQDFTEKNILTCNIDRSNERDMLELICRQFEITDDGFYKNYNHPLCPLSSISMNMLLSHYFREDKNVVFLDYTGQNTLEGKNPANKIALCSELPLSLASESQVAEYVQTILDNELFFHINSRPKTILIPFSVSKPHADGHELLLAVEPSNIKKKRARITIINTHGNSLKMYQSYEKAALNAARLVYNDPETIILRNEKRLWTTPSCTHNTLDILRELVTVPNIQEAIQKGLKPMNAHQDAVARKKHWNDIKLFLEKKLNETKQAVGCFIEEEFFTQLFDGAKKTLASSLN